MQKSTMIQLKAGTGNKLRLVSGKLLHDLLQPLNAHGLVALHLREVLQQALPPEHPAFGLLDMLNHVAQSEEAQLKALRLFWRLQEAGEVSEIRLLAVRGLLEQLVESLCPGRNEVALDVSCAAELQVVADSVLLAGLLGALLDNAVAHAVSQVRVLVRQRGQRIHITISDDGAGLTVGAAGKLGTPFFRDRQHRRRGEPGLGLGIPVAVLAARQLGARIAHLPQDGGCAFRVSLAAAAPATKGRAGSAALPLRGVVLARSLKPDSQLADWLAAALGELEFCALEPEGLDFSLLAAEGGFLILDHAALDCCLESDPFRHWLAQRPVLLLLAPGEDAPALALQQVEANWQPLRIPASPSRVRSAVLALLHKGGLAGKTPEIV